MYPDKDPIKLRRLYKLCKGMVFMINHNEILYQIIDNPGGSDNKKKFCNNHINGEK